MSQASSLGDVIARVRSEADSGPATIGSIVTAAGTRATGPLLFVPALIAISPLGAIPGLPTMLGIVIVLVAIQSLVTPGNIWLPAKLRKKKVSAEKLPAALSRAEAFVRPIDRVLGGRLTALARRPLSHVVVVVCILLAVMMPPLEIVPFAVAVPAAAILLFSIGLITEDGAVIVAGYVATAGAVYLAATTI